MHCRHQCVAQGAGFRTETQIQYHQQLTNGTCVPLLLPEPLPMVGNIDAAFAATAAFAWKAGRHQDKNERIKQTTYLQSQGEMCTCTKHLFPSEDLRERWPRFRTRWRRRNDQRLLAGLDCQHIFPFCLVQNSTTQQQSKLAQATPGPAGNVAVAAPTDVRAACQCNVNSTVTE